MLFRVHIIDSDIVDFPGPGALCQRLHQSRWLAGGLSDSNGTVTPNLFDCSVTVRQLRFVLFLVSHIFLHFDQQGMLVVSLGFGRVPPFVNQHRALEAHYFFAVLIESSS